MKQSRASNADDNYKKFKPDDDQLIKRDIGEGYRGADADGGLLRGGAALQAERTAEDTERIGKFLTTPKGALFTVKQATLQAFNGDKRTNIYNPTSVLQSLPNNISEQRHIEKEQGVGGFLKGLIGISKLVWPPGLSGKEIDAFARSALWACGHDFEHLQALPYPNGHFLIKRCPKSTSRKISYIHIYKGTETI